MPPPGGVRTSVTFQAQTMVQGWGPFSPGVPLTPVTNEPVRGFDFKPNINTTIRPRAYEPFGFPQLRAFSNVELVRLAIETRKDQIEREDWAIKPISRSTKGAEERIAEVTKFWRKPDGVTPLATFLRLSLEDLLALDAPAFEMRRTRGGKLLGLEIVPGDTIHPMVDASGRRPRDPSAIAYQQVIKGVAWANLTTRDLLYVPRNPRPNHLYGLGPVEQIIVTINTILRRQASQLSFFTESNVPAGMVTAPEGWDLSKIVELQQWFDDKISGSQAEQNKLIWGPAGSKYQAFKDAPIKDEFDEWLARIVAFAFSLPPTPFVRQMNRSTAQTDQDRGLEEGLEPIKLWAKRWIDSVIQDEMGCPDLEFTFVETPSIDPNLQSQIDDRNLKNGSACLDEVRDGRGQDPLPNGLGAKPLIYTASGVMTLEDALAPDPEPDALIEPGMPAHAGQPAPGEDGGEQEQPGKAPRPDTPPPKQPAKAEKLAKVAPISPTRPKARRAAAAASKTIKPIFTKAADDVAGQVEKALTKLGKADRDPDLTSAEVARAIADGLDLETLLGLGDAISDDLLDLAFDSGQLALTSVGVTGDDQITNRVHQRAVDYASARGAELVSVDGDESLIAATRDMIKATITDGLQRNIGADAIADAVQESTAFSPARADTIAKTEIAKANGEGKAAGWREAQAAGLVITKHWLTSENDCCDICQANEDAGDIPLDEPFPSGDDVEPAHPHCQCVTSATAAEPDDE